MPKSFSLILSAPGTDAVHYRLSGDRVSLGRGEMNHILVTDKAVSSRHCQFDRAASGGYRLIDLGSTNGTRVNGQRVMSAEGVPLKNGDRILFGETIEGHFIEAIEIDTSPKPAPAVKPAAPPASASPFQAPAATQIQERRPKAGAAPAPVAVWVDASEEPLHEEMINPVAAAVARQQGSPGPGRPPGRK